MSAFKQKTILVLLFLLSILITFSSHPWIVDVSRAAGIEKGSILSRYIIVVFVLLFLLCFHGREILQSTVIRRFLYMILVVALFSFLTYGLFMDKKLFGELRALVISLVALSIGWQLRLSDVQIRNVLLVYAICTLYVGLMQVFTNVGGFVIETQYLTDNKNSLGVMLATSIAVFAYFAFEKDKKKIVTVFCWGIVIALFAIVLTIRARAATLIAVFVVLLILYRRINKSYFVILLVSIPFLVILGYLLLPAGIKEYVLSSFVSGFEGGDITSSRSIRNQMALRYLSSHPLLGNLQHGADSFGWIHNYPLLQLFNNGLLFGFPILTLYLYLFIKIGKGVSNCKVDSIREVGCFAALVPFIVSLAEPTFPFGPGTATVFNFIVLGVAIKYETRRYGVLSV